MYSFLKFYLAFRVCCIILSSLFIFASQVWTLAQLINFNLVPVEFRPIFGTCVFSTLLLKPNYSDRRSKDGSSWIQGHA